MILSLIGGEIKGWAHEAIRIVAVHLEVYVRESTRVECIRLSEYLKIKHLPHMTSDYSVFGQFIPLSIIFNSEGKPPFAS